MLDRIKYYETFHSYFNFFKASPKLNTKMKIRCTLTIFYVKINSGYIFAFA